MASWRVMQVNWLDNWASGLVDAKVKNSVTYYKIPQIRKVGVNEGQRPTYARNRAFESINDYHIAFGVYVN